MGFDPATLNTSIVKPAISGAKKAARASDVSKVKLKLKVKIKKKDDKE